MKIFDANGCIMGRLASYVAKALLEGEQVHVVNAEKAIVSGTKHSVFREYIEKRQLNHERKGPFYPRMPHLMFKRSVRGMIPYQTPRGRAAFKRLRVDIGMPAGAGTPEIVEQAQMVSGTTHVTLGDISRELGAKF